MVTIAEEMFSISPDIESDYNSIVSVSNNADSVKQGDKRTNAYITNILRLRKPIVHSDDGTLSWCSKSCR